MPTYQYACPDCGNQFEQRQKFTDDPIKRCPQCGRRHVYRVVSQVAVTFKGSGWYITDSRSSNGKSGGSKSVKPMEPKEHEHKPASSAGESAGGGESKAADASAKPAAETKSSKTAEPAS
jgi:putative FmdB family regulatory protein